MVKKILLIGFLIISLLVAGCMVFGSYQPSVDYGQKHIEKLYKTPAVDSYVDYAESVRKEYTLKDHALFVSKVQSLGEYLGIKSDGWKFDSDAGVDSYTIDYALRYPDYTQYVRLTLVKANGNFQMIGDRFIPEAKYKLMKEKEKAEEK